MFVLVDIADRRGGRFFADAFTGFGHHIGELKAADSAASSARRVPRNPTPRPSPRFRVTGLSPTLFAAAHRRSPGQPGYYRRGRLLE
ncbi:hypothetical protein I552_9165 [Mycobacterium xenopi 3993]|nr:hypothetical protein I552_9165 [Mycobacterium xenopi 3993]